jgi:hypothetical protein
MFRRAWLLVLTTRFVMLWLKLLYEQNAGQEDFENIHLLHLSFAHFIAFLGRAVEMRNFKTRKRRFDESVARASG